MTRNRILWLESWIALCGAVFWMIPPALPKAKVIVLVSVVWALWCFFAIFLEFLENWAHRLSSFVGFTLFTVEGILGLVGAVTKPGILLIALLHGSTFVLAIVGKYKAKMSRRPRRSLERIAEDMMAEVKAQKAAELAQEEEEEGA